MATPVPYRNSPLLRVIFSATLLAVGFSVSSCKKDSGQTPASASGPHLKWNVRTLTSGVSHPAIGGDGTIYVGTSGGVEAFDPAGKMLWKVTYASPGTPVIADDGTLYFESHHGLVLGISSDGQLVWQPKLGLIGFKAPPALGPDTSLFYVNTASDLWAFQPKRSDRESWSLSTFREGSLDSSSILPGTARVSGAAQNGAPIVYGDSTVLVPRQNFLHAFSTNGSSYWRNELSPGDLGMAAIGRDGTVYVGDDRGILYAVDPSGTTKWRFDLLHRRRCRLRHQSRWLAEMALLQTPATVFRHATDSGRQRYAVHRCGIRSARLRPRRHLEMENSRNVAHLANHHRPRRHALFRLWLLLALLV